MNVPKPRPPRPHSSRVSIASARRHRAAAKPSTVTSRKRKTKTLTATPFIGPPSVATPAAERRVRAGRPSAREQAVMVSTAATGISANWNQ